MTLNLFCNTHFCWSVVKQKRNYHNPPVGRWICHTSVINDRPESGTIENYNKRDHKSSWRVNVTKNSLSILEVCSLFRGRFHPSGSSGFSDTYRPGTAARESQTAYVEITEMQAHFAKFKRLIKLRRSLSRCFASRVLAFYMFSRCRSVQIVPFQYGFKGCCTFCWQFAGLCWSCPIPKLDITF